MSAVPYEAETGYVNAVGKLLVRWGRLDLETFAPLGEAVFSEAPGTAVGPVHTASGPPARP